MEARRKRDNDGEEGAKRRYEADMSKKEGEEFIKDMLKARTDTDIENAERVRRLEKGPRNPITPEKDHDFSKDDVPSDQILRREAEAAERAVAIRSGNNVWDHKIPVFEKGPRNPITPEKDHDFSKEDVPSNQILEREAKRAQKAAKAAQEAAERAAREAIRAAEKLLDGMPEARLNTDKEAAADKTKREAPSKETPTEETPPAKEASPPSPAAGDSSAASEDSPATTPALTDSRTGKLPSLKTYNAVRDDLTNVPTKSLQKAAEKLEDMDTKVPRVKNYLEDLNKELEKRKPEEAAAAGKAAQEPAAGKAAELAVDPKANEEAEAVPASQPTADTNANDASRPTAEADTRTGALPSITGYKWRDDIFDNVGTDKLKRMVTRLSKVDKKDSTMSTYSADINEELMKRGELQPPSLSQDPTSMHGVIEGVKQDIFKMRQDKEEYTGKELAKIVAEMSPQQREAIAALGADPKLAKEYINLPTGTQRKILALRQHINGYGWTHAEPKATHSYYLDKAGSRLENSAHTGLVDWMNMGWSMWRGLSNLAGTDTPLESTALEGANQHGAPQNTGGGSQASVDPVPNPKPIVEPPTRPESLDLLEQHVPEVEVKSRSSMKRKGLLDEMREDGVRAVNKGSVDKLVGSFAKMYSKLSRDASTAVDVNNLYKKTSTKAAKMELYDLQSKLRVRDIISLYRDADRLMKYYRDSENLRIQTFRLAVSLQANLPKGLRTEVFASSQGVLTSQFCSMALSHAIGIKEALKKDLPEDRKQSLTIHLGTISLILLSMSRDALDSSNVERKRFVKIVRGQVESMIDDAPQLSAILDDEGPPSPFIETSSTPPKDTSAMTLTEIAAESDIVQLVVSNSSNVPFVTPQKEKDVLLSVMDMMPRDPPKRVLGWKRSVEKMLETKGYDSIEDIGSSIEGRMTKMAAKSWMDASLGS